MAIDPSLKVHGFLALSIPEIVKETIDPISKQCTKLLRESLGKSDIVRAVPHERFDIRLGIFFAKDADHAQKIKEAIKTAIRNFAPFYVSPSKQIALIESNHRLPSHAGKPKFQSFMGCHWVSEALENLRRDIKNAITKEGGQIGREEYTPYTSLATVASLAPHCVDKCASPPQWPETGAVKGFQIFPEKDLTLTLSFFPEDFIPKARHVWQTLKTDPNGGVNAENEKEIEDVISKIWTTKYQSMDHALQTLHTAYTTLQGLLKDKAKTNRLVRLIGKEEDRLATEDL